MLGAGWLILKTENETQDWARKCALYSMIYVPILMGIVSLWIPFIDKDIFETWFKIPNILYLIPVPILTILTTYFLYKAITEKSELMPFLLSILLFCFGFIGFGISLWPWAVPRKLTIWETAASAESLSFMLIGVTVILPIILIYTGYSYYIFRGKSTKEKMY